MKEVVVERTARILKQADPGHAPPPPVARGRPAMGSGTEFPIAIVAAVIAVIALLAAFFAR